MKIPRKRSLSTVSFLLLLGWSCTWPSSISGQDHANPDEVPIDQFQYKNIMLGILVDFRSFKLFDGLKFQTEFIAMINATISGLNNNSYHPVHTGSGGARYRLPANLGSGDNFANSNPGSGSGNNAPGNGTRVSTISIHVMDDIYDTLEHIPEISVLFTLLSCEDTHFMNKKMLARYGPVVHIGVTEPGCGRIDSSSAVTVPLTTFRRNADLLQLLMDLRSQRVLPGWREAVIINDVEAGDEIIDVFGEGFSSQWDNLPTITQTIYNVDSMSLKSSFSDQIEDILAKYQKSAPGNYIMITKSTNVNRVLEAASRTGMLSIMKQWIFISPDPVEDLFSWNYIETKIIDDGVNIGFIMNSSITSTKVASMSDHLHCDTEALLVLLSDVVEGLALWEFDLYLQVSNEEWDIIKPTRVDRVVNITEIMTNQLSDHVLEFCDKNSSTWNLLAAENGQKGKQIFEVGWWNPLTGLRMTDEILPHVTGGFRGRRIHVASMHFPPWQIISHDEGNVTYSGLMFEVLNHMSKDLNFTYKVIEPRPGETWGHLQSDGSWTGMMKMVAENKVVIAAAAFTVTPERAGHVSFTNVLEREAYGFMVNRPQELSRVLLFAAPFSYKVWICIFITVIIVAPVLNLVHRNSYFYKFYYTDLDSTKGLFLMKNCYWYIYGSLLQQGGIHLPEALSGRMLIGFWWLFVIVTVTTYSGNLVAFLTFPKVESPVNTVEDLTHYRGVESWGFLQGSVIEDHLMRSPEPRFEVLYKKAEKHAAFNKTVLNLVSHHQHAYIDWTIVLLTAIQDSLKATGKCEYIIGSETFFEEKIALAVPKNSPYLPIFNKQIGQMSQTGLLKKWKSRHWPTRNQCSKMTVSAGNRKVGVGDMQGSFYLLSLGFFISLLVLIVEVILVRRKKRKMIDVLQKLVGGKEDAKFWQQKQFPFLQ